MIATTYAAIRPKLKTGDLILAEGKSEISEVIKFFCGPRSHIGMVITQNGLDAVFLFESTTLSNIKDVESGAFVKGVQLVLLSERIASYNGELYARRLNKPLLPEQIAKITNFRREVKGRPYEKNKLNLVATLFRGFGTDEDLSSLFCSELVAEAYQEAGLLPDTDVGGMPSDAYKPTDFSEVSKSPIGLLGQYGFLSEERILP